MIPGIVAGGFVPASAGIRLVGLKTAGVTTNVALTIAVASGLSGGLAAGASVGDYVVVCAGASESVPAATSLPGGLQLIHGASSVDTVTASIRVWAGFLTNAADIVLAAPGAGRALAAAVHVFRDVAEVEAFRTAAGANGAYANPPAVVAEATGSWAYVTGTAGTANTVGLAYSSPSDLVDIANASFDAGTYAANVLAGTKRGLTPGSFDPEVFGGFTDDAAWSWLALTLIMYPVGVTLPAATAGATSYANGGGSGARGTSDFAFEANFNLSTGVHAGLWNGSTTDNTQWFLSGANAGNIMEWDFYRKRVIDEFRWYQSSSATHGTWEFQGSQNGIDWTTLGSSFTLGGATTSTYSNGNTTGYRHYRMLGISGSRSNGPFIREIEFKISP